MGNKSIKSKAMDLIHEGKEHFRSTVLNGVLTGAFSVGSTLLILLTLARGVHGTEFLARVGDLNQRHYEVLSACAESDEYRQIAEQLTEQYSSEYVDGKISEKDLEKKLSSIYDSDTVESNAMQYESLARTKKVLNSIDNSIDDANENAIDDFGYMGLYAGLSALGICAGKLALNETRKENAQYARCKRELQKIEKYLKSKSNNASSSDKTNQNESSDENTL